MGSHCEAVGSPSAVGRILEKELPGNRLAQDVPLRVRAYVNLMPDEPRRMSCWRCWTGAAWCTKSQRTNLVSKEGGVVPATALRIRTAAYPLCVFNAGVVFRGLTSV
jgi:hypothetical protein